MNPAAVHGLTPPEVRERVLAGQVNTPPPAPGRTIAQILRANVLTRFNAILGVLFVLIIIVGPPQDALFGALLVVNTAIGVEQELRAKRALDRSSGPTASSWTRHCSPGRPSRHRRVLVTPSAPAAS